MNDNRSKRKSNVIQFIPLIEKDRIKNRSDLIEKAKTLELEGFNFALWNDPVWTINSGRLLKDGSKNIKKVTLNFSYSEKLNGGNIDSYWADLIKAIVVIRFHRANQAASNLRNFISAVSFVIKEMVNLDKKLFELTPEYLDKACSRLSLEPPVGYSAGVSYNMHKAIGEFAAYCDANGLCNVRLDYKFSRMNRPDNAGGIGQMRLDDLTTLETKSDKLVDPIVYKIIGELYLNVPSNHKYRFYVLVLSLLAMLGRRFSEIATLPKQEILSDDEGRYYLKYFPRKTSAGDAFTPFRKLFLPSEIVSIVKPIFSELNKISLEARETAFEMRASKGPNLFFLIDYSDTKKFYKEDLVKIGISTTVLSINGWIRKNGFANSDDEKLTSQGKSPANASWYTNKKGITEYCKRDFHLNSIEPVHIDQFGQKYFLENLLLVKNLGLSSGVYAHWLASQMTHSMMTTFLRYFPALCMEFAEKNLEVDFTSHEFRHTLNTLMDEGGLSELLQTEWFGRTNSKDTKAYQHTSREKKALMLRADIKAGRVGGRLAEQIKFIPVDIQDAVLAARVKSVLDVGPGICIHNYIQTPCGRHSQCSADCNDYVWAKNDGGRKEELKRIYAITYIARQTAELKTGDAKPKKSVDWLVHNDKKLKVLTQQLKDNGIEPFDVNLYFEGL